MKGWEGGGGTSIYVADRGVVVMARFKCSIATCLSSTLLLYYRSTKYIINLHYFFLNKLLSLYYASIVDISYCLLQQFFLFLFDEF